MYLKNVLLFPQVFLLLQQDPLNEIKRFLKIDYLKSKIQKESFIQEYLPNESRIVQSSADNVP